MAENKQYITQVQDNGSVMISEDVISAIVAHAISEVEGIIGLEVKPGADIADLIGKKGWGKGVKITISEDDAVKIDCNVSVSSNFIFITPFIFIIYTRIQIYFILSHRNFRILRNSFNFQYIIFIFRLNQNHLYFYLYYLAHQQL